jgi:hypothetical protein
MLTRFDSFVVLRLYSEFEIFALPPIALRSFVSRKGSDVNKPGFEDVYYW